MTRVISLPAINRQISLGAYVAGIKLAKANPERTFEHGLTCWYSCTGAKIVAQFREGLHERINAGSYRMAEGWRRAGATRGEFRRPAPRGRKDCRDWQIQAWRDSRRIHDRLQRRVVIHGLETAEARKRFAHLIDRGDD